MPEAPLSAAATRRRRIVAVVLAGAPVAALLAAIGCSLGLDASLINAPVDGGIGPGRDSGPTPDGGGPSDASVDHVTALPDAGCMSDNDCKVAGNVCITSQHCDMNEHVCVLGICEQGGGDAAVCQSAVCEQSGTCSIPVTYGFHATSFTVTDGTTGCGGAFQSCFAVVWPFAFVGTMSDVVVYQISDPANSAPPTVALNGVTFVPQRIVAVDRRVYFIGSPTGGGATVRLPVAWVDVPGIAALTQLDASSGLITSSPTNLSGVFPTTNGALFVTDVTQHVAPTEILAAPVDNTTSITALDSTLIPSSPVNHAVVAASWTRLVTYGWDPTTSFAQFDFVDSAGTSNAMAEGAVQVVGAMGQTCPQSTFAQGPDGSLLWMTAVGSAPDGGPDLVTSARMAWLLASGTAPSFSLTDKVDVETYPQMPGFCTTVAGPIAWLDTNTALVVAADQSTLTQSIVQVASRAAEPPSILTQSHGISASVGQIAAAGSNGLGYILAQDLPTTTDATLHIFAPSCN